MVYLLTLLIWLSPAILAADDGNASGATGLAHLDWLILCAYAAGTIYLGYRFGKQQTSTREYFTGTGRMHPFLIGVSLFATLLSTNSYLSYPGEALGKGPVIFVKFAAYPVIFYLFARFFLPVYMRHRVTSAYELLEERLGLGARLLGGGMFIVLRLMWMAALINFAAGAMVVIMGIPPDSKFTIVAVVTAVAVVYTTLGGLRAVVITDLMQTVLLAGGAVVVIVMVTLDAGGFGWIPTSWHKNWDPQPFWSTDLSVRATAVGTFQMFLLWFVLTLGGDQTTVQRFMATGDASAARRALKTQLWSSLLVGTLLLLVGLALLGFYESHPAALAGLDLKENADDIFPYFIARGLPVGISGLVVAAMFAAAMSSIDSGVNSITAVVSTDFLERTGIGPQTESGKVAMARLVSILIGAIVIGVAVLIASIPGNITAVVTKTNILTAPIFCLFFFALFVRSATPAGVWWGALAGTVTAILVSYSGPIFIAGFDKTIHTDPVSFQWMYLASLLVNLAVGFGVSAFTTARLAESEPPQDAGI